MEIKYKILKISVILIGVFLFFTGIWLYMKNLIQWRDFMSYLAISFSCMIFGFFIVKRIKESLFTMVFSVGFIVYVLAGVVLEIIFRIWGEKDPIFSNVTAIGSTEVFLFIVLLVFAGKQMFQSNN